MSWRVECRSFRVCRHHFYSVDNYADEMNVIIYISKELQLFFSFLKFQASCFLRFLCDTCIPCLCQVMSKLCEQVEILSGVYDAQNRK